MFTAALLVVVLNWKQSNGEWIKSLWFRHSKEYFSVQKKEQIIDTHNKNEPPMQYTE